MTMTPTRENVGTAVCLWGHLIQHRSPRKASGRNGPKLRPEGEVNTWWGVRGEDWQRLRANWGRGVETQVGRGGGEGPWRGGSSVGQGLGKQCRMGSNHHELTLGDLEASSLKLLMYLGAQNNRVLGGGAQTSADIPPLWSPPENRKGSALFPWNEDRHTSHPPPKCVLGAVTWRRGTGTSVLLPVMHRWLHVPTIYQSYHLDLTDKPPTDDDCRDTSWRKMRDSYS